ncbi:hypothetical protein [Amycolatopsis sp. NBC_00438]|uniref:hypothetical protein n=1 Tax=Amycolatopsis sp. NBC_00438 TaxID=2903558 RepID=UPI002E1D9CB9
MTIDTPFDDHVLVGTGPACPTGDGGAAFFAAPTSAVAWSSADGDAGFGSSTSLATRCGRTTWFACAGCTAWRFTAGR